MRTTLELPDTLMRQLKARAALEGRSLRDLVLDLVQRGLKAPAETAPVPTAKLPTLRAAQPLDATLLNHAALSELASE